MIGGGVSAIVEYLKKIIDQIKLKYDMLYLYEDVLAYLNISLLLNLLETRSHMSINCLLQKQPPLDYEIKFGGSKFVLYKEIHQYVYAIEIIDRMKTDDNNLRDKFRFLEGLVHVSPIASEKIKFPENKFLFPPLKNKEIFIQRLLRSDKITDDIKEKIKNTNLNVTKEDIVMIPKDQKTEAKNFILETLTNMYNDQQIEDTDDWFWINLITYKNYGLNIGASLCEINDINVRFLVTFLVLIYLIYIIKEIHQKHMIHYDIKIDNILVGNKHVPSQNHIVLIDFEYSQKLDALNSNDYLTMHRHPVLITYKMLEKEKQKQKYSNIDILDHDIHSVGLSMFVLLINCDYISNLYDPKRSETTKPIDLEFFNSDTSVRSHPHSVVYELEFSSKYRGASKSQTEMFNFICNLCDYGFTKTCHGSPSIFNVAGTLYDELKRIYITHKKDFNDLINKHKDNPDIPNLPGKIHADFFT